jgi:hypothetical protein
MTRRKEAYRLPRAVTKLYPASFPLQSAQRWNTVFLEESLLRSVEPTETLGCHSVGVRFFPVARLSKGHFHRATDQIDIVSSYSRASRFLLR